MVRIVLLDLARRSIRALISWWCFKAAPNALFLWEGTTSVFAVVVAVPPLLAWFLPFRLLPVRPMMTECYRYWTLLLFLHVWITEDCVHHRDYRYCVDRRSGRSALDVGRHTNQKGNNQPEREKKILAGVANTLKSCAERGAISDHLAIESFHDISLNHRSGKSK